MPCFHMILIIMTDTPHKHRAGEAKHDIRQSCIVLSLGVSDKASKGNTPSRSDMQSTKMKGTSLSCRNSAITNLRNLLFLSYLRVTNSCLADLRRPYVEG